MKVKGLLVLYCVVVVVGCVVFGAVIGACCMGVGFEIFGCGEFMGVNEKEFFVE